jgi:hypothetical protein
MSNAKCVSIFGNSVYVCMYVYIYIHIYIHIHLAGRINQDKLITCAGYL